MMLDALAILAPLLRVRPELQDFCRFGGDWRSTHAPEAEGWAAFHIVTHGACEIERSGQTPVRLEAGDVLLLPHGDGHVVYGGEGRHAFRPISTAYRDTVRIKRTEGVAVETELICGRLHLETGPENLLLAALPPVIVLRAASHNAPPRLDQLVGGIRDELDGQRGAALAIASDLASALFMMLLREHLETDPPADGLLALLANRETARATAAMLRDPARDWDLDELAALAVTSRATLVRAFRRASGQAPYAFLTELRLHLARDRILRSSDTLGLIAVGVGYQSEAALSRAFHRRFSVRPGALRASGGASA